MRLSSTLMLAPVSIQNCTSRSASSLYIFSGKGSCRIDASAIELRVRGPSRGWQQLFPLPRFDKPAPDLHVRRECTLTRRRE